MNYRQLFILFLSSSGLFYCTSQPPETSSFRIYCAASLLPVITAVKAEWSKNHHEKIVINAASSGTLARQIEYGAECDIYLSANQEWMNYLIESLNLKSQAITIASNQLVVCAPKETELDSMDIDALLKRGLSSMGRIAMADPGHVPLGKYTQQFFSFYGIEKKLIKNLILTKDARSTLRLVELGEVSLGVVYLSDAFTSKNVKVIAQIPTKCHEQISYTCIFVSSKNSSSQMFLNYLISNENKNHWIENGFLN